MLKRIALLALAVALAAPATASAEVTIKAGGSKYREQLFPNGFRIKGKTGTYRGPVTVEVDEFPYGSYADAGTATTNDKGEYVFPKVAPTRNARVRVRAGSEHSKPLELYVHPGFKWSYRVTSSNKLKITVTYSGHPGFAPPADGFFVYISKVKDRRRAIRLGGAQRMTQIGDGRWRFSGSLKLPSSRRTYGFYPLVCTRGMAASGYGRIWPLDAGCGKKIVKV